MATGFHGFHVIIGTIFLLVCLMRAYAGLVHAAAAPRLRVRRLVLALRRRGVAVPVRLHLRLGLLGRPEGLPASDRAARLGARGAASRTTRRSPVPPASAVARAAARQAVQGFLAMHPLRRGLDYGFADAGDGPPFRRAHRGALSWARAVLESPTSRRSGSMVVSCPDIAVPRRLRPQGLLIALHTEQSRTGSPRLVTSAGSAAPARPTAPRRACALLLGLGVWQSSGWPGRPSCRRSRRTTAPPVPLPPGRLAAHRPRLRLSPRVGTGTFEHDKEIHVFRPLGRAPRGPFSGLGDLVLTPLRLAVWRHRDRQPRLRARRTASIRRPGPAARSPAP